MLDRISELIKHRENFAFETTLATRSFKNIVHQAKTNNYQVTLIYFWLESVELAKLRVKTRVDEGGHDIPKDIIERRYYRGIHNLFSIYSDICDLVLLYDNSKSNPELVYEKSIVEKPEIHNMKKYNKILSLDV